MSLRIEGTDGKARTGTLVLPSGRQIETPTMLLYTRRGGAPNLTVDLVESLQPRAQALQLNALQLYVLFGIFFATVSHWLTPTI